MQKSKDELQVMALGEFKENDEMYKIVDFLNKNLKSRGLIFGLTRKDGRDKIAIYDLK